MIQGRRFSDNELDDRRVASELLAAAQHVASLQAGWKVRALTSHPELADCVLSVEDADEAVAIHRQMHYIGSPRPDGIHLSLRAPLSAGGHLLCLATLSSMDLPHLAPVLPESSNLSNDYYMLSRFFVRDGGRPNLASYFLGRVFAWVRVNMPGVDGILTYLNPNVGFTGTLYHATNWILVGLEHKRRYLYLDDNYVTDRRMIEEFGTADYDLLKRTIGHQITRSHVALEPLKIFVYPLKRSLLRRLLRVECPADVQPPVGRVGV
jgi:hypothetical protein